MIRLSFDSMKFPMARVSRVGAFQMWPVTRFQFKQFIQETGQFNDSRFDSIMNQNPEISIEQCNASNYEGLFMTGLLPDEALAYAKWMGDDYDLPTEEEWLAFYKAVQSQFLNFRLSPYGYASEALAIGKTLGSFLRTPLTFTLLDDGVAEWVRWTNQFRGRGAPRDDFFPNMWNPLHDSVNVIDKSQRLFYFGFRLIRRPHINGAL